MCRVYGVCRVSRVYRVYAVYRLYRVYRGDIADIGETWCREFRVFGCRVSGFRFLVC